MFQELTRLFLLLRSHAIRRRFHVAANVSERPREGILQSHEDLCELTRHFCANSVGYFIAGVDSAATVFYQCDDYSTVLVGTYALNWRGDVVCVPSFYCI